MRAIRVTLNIVCSSPKSTNGQMPFLHGLLRAPCSPARPSPSSTTKEDCLLALLSCFANAVGLPYRRNLVSSVGSQRESFDWFHVWAWAYSFRLMGLVVPTL